jgi:hypothetical protein
VRARGARERGYWLIQEGDHLNRIARIFHPDDARARARLRKHLYRSNPAAFADGRGFVLVVGEKLFLPEELRLPPAQAGIDRAESIPPDRTMRIAPSATPPSSAPPPAVVRLPLAEPPPYIDLEMTDVPDEPGDVRKGSDTPGLRVLAVDAKAELRDSDRAGRGREGGIDVLYRHETLNFGEFVLDAGVRASRPGTNETLQARGNSARGSLYNNSLPVAPGWHADSVIGVVRTPLNVLVTSGYRVSLPSTLFSGFASQVHSSTQEFRLLAGRVGRLEGLTSQTFETTTGEIYGLGFAQRLSPLWTVGTQIIATRGNQEVADHETLAVAAEFLMPIPRTRFKTSLLVDDRGHLGGWADAESPAGRGRQRFGAFRLDPGLGWSEAALQNDQQGAYWRYELPTRAYTVTLGADHLSTNVKNVADRAGQLNDSVFGTLSMRIDRNLTVGGGLTGQAARRRVVPGPDTRIASGNLFSTFTTRLGVTRVDFSRFESRKPGAITDRIDNYSLSQEWPAAMFTLSNSLTHSREEVQGKRTLRSSVGASVRGHAVRDLFWDASVVWAQVGNELGIARNFNASANTRWQFAPEWSASAQLSWNTIDPLPSIPGGITPPLNREKRLLLGIRYETTRGVPYQAMGMASGGSGDLRGMVFFDENGDGERQPHERGAAGLTVFLDGRYPATTDSDGRFVFRGISAGRHTLRLLNENLPLPWTLQEERPLEVSVPLRGEADVAVPLARIRP